MGVARFRSINPVVLQRLPAIPRAWQDGRRTILTVLSMVALALAGGSFIEVTSTNQVSGGSNDVRWEPSSSVGSTWVTSWNDLKVFQGLTSSWGGPWGPAFRHTLNGYETADLYLAFNPAQGNPPQGLHNLVMINSRFDPSIRYELGFRTSTDSSGSNWNPPVAVYSPADYPSVSAIGNTIVIGFNTVIFVGEVCNSGCVAGFQTVVSNNGGQSWNGPFTVTRRGNPHSCGQWECRDPI